MFSDNRTHHLLKTFQLGAIISCLMAREIF